MSGQLVKIRLYFRAGMVLGLFRIMSVEATPPLPTCNLRGDSAALLGDDTPPRPLKACTGEGVCALSHTSLYASSL